MTLFDAVSWVPPWVWGTWETWPVFLFGSIPLLSAVYWWLGERLRDRHDTERDAERERHEETVARLMDRLRDSESRATRAEAATRTLLRRLADQHEYIGSLERSVCDLTETVEFYRGEYELVSTISPCAPRRRRGHCRQGAQR